MKILNTIEYNEKLKIDAMKLSDLDQLCYKEKFDKNMLRQFDIVKINGCLFLSFLKDTIFSYVDLFQRKPFTNTSRLNNGVFLWYYKNFDESHYMFFDSYLDDLTVKDTDDRKWDINEVYIKPNTVDLKITDADMLSQKSLESIIEKYNYKHIEIKR